MDNKIIKITFHGASAMTVPYTLGLTLQNCRDDELSFKC